MSADANLLPEFCLAQEFINKIDEGQQLLINLENDISKLKKLGFIISVEIKIGTSLD